MIIHLLNIRKTYRKTVSFQHQIDITSSFAFSDVIIKQKQQIPTNLCV